MRRDKPPLTPYSSFSNEELNKKLNEMLQELSHEPLIKKETTSDPDEENLLRSLGKAYREIYGTEPPWEKQQKQQKLTPEQKRLLSIAGVRALKNVSRLMKKLHFPWPPKNPQKLSLISRVVEQPFTLWMMLPPMDNGAVGMHDAYTETLQLKTDMPDSQLAAVATHELLHALSVQRVPIATTDMPYSVGFANKADGTGIALNEGMTELLTIYALHEAGSPRDDIDNYYHKSGYLPHIHLIHGIIERLSEKAHVSRNEALRYLVNVYLDGDSDKFYNTLFNLYGNTMALRLLTARSKEDVENLTSFISVDKSE